MKTLPNEVQKLFEYVKAGFSTKKGVQKNILEKHEKMCVFKNFSYGNCYPGEDIVP